MRGIARALHHGNRDGAVHDDVGHRAPRDGAVEARRDDGHLGRATSVRAHRPHRHVGEELVAAHGVERLTEEDVGDDDRRGHGQRYAEDAVAIEVEVNGDALPGRALRIEHTRQQPRELRVEHAPERDPHERPAGQAAHAFEDERDREHTEQQLVPGDGRRVRLRRGLTRLERLAEAETEAGRAHVDRQVLVSLGVDHLHVAGRQVVALAVVLDRQEHAEILLVEEGERQVMVNLSRPQSTDDREGGQQGPLDDACPAVELTEAGDDLGHARITFRRAGAAGPAPSPASRGPAP